MTRGNWEIRRFLADQGTGREERGPEKPKMAHHMVSTTLPTDLYQGLVIEASQLKVTPYRVMQDVVLGLVSGNLVPRRPGDFARSRSGLGTRGCSVGVALRTKRQIERMAAKRGCSVSLLLKASLRRYLLEVGRLPTEAKKSRYICSLPEGSKLFSRR